MKKSFAKIILFVLVPAMLLAGCKIEFVNRNAISEEVSQYADGGCISVPSETLPESSAGAKPGSSSAAVAKPSVNSKTAASDKSRTDKSASSQAAQKSSGPHVTIMIDCSNASAWNSKHGYKISTRVVPKSGVILAKTAVNLQDGDTVYSVLIRVEKSTGILVTHSEDYITGIHELSQFACGAASGWLYSVNGSFPSKSCGSYKLSHGDAIVWRYTCAQGDISGYSVS